MKYSAEKTYLFHI